MEFAFARCARCEKKTHVARMFATKNPHSNKGWEDAFINPKTGNINHPWQQYGRWIWICADCLPQVQGLYDHRPAAAMPKNA